MPLNFILPALRAAYRVLSPFALPAALLLAVALIFSNVSLRAARHDLKDAQAQLAQARSQNAELSANLKRILARADAAERAYQQTSDRAAALARRSLRYASARDPGPARRCDAASDLISSWLEERQADERLR